MARPTAMAMASTKAKAKAKVIRERHRGTSNDTPQNCPGFGWLISQKNLFFGGLPTCGSGTPQPELSDAFVISCELSHRMAVCILCGTTFRRKKIGYAEQKKRESTAHFCLQERTGWSDQSTTFSQIHSPPSGFGDSPPGTGEAPTGFHGGRRRWHVVL